MPTNYWSRNFLSEIDFASKKCCEGSILGLQNSGQRKFGYTNLDVNNDLDAKTISSCKIWAKKIGAKKFGSQK